MLPVLLRIGGWALPSYTAMLALGVIASMAVALAEARRLGVAWRRVADYFLAMTIGGVIGLITKGFPLRLALSGFRLSPQFWDWMGYEGALMPSILALAMLSGWLYGRIVRVPNGTLHDIGALGWVTAVAIWRVGCLMAGCCWGLETTSPLAMYLPDLGGHWAWRYPTQIMEGVFALALLLLLWVLRKRKPFDGYLALIAIVLYFAGRFAESYLRGDNYYVLPGLSEIQLYSLIIVSIALWRLAHLSMMANQKRENARLLAGVR